MKRIFGIARSHGIGTVCARGAARAGVWRRDLQRLLMARLSERQAMRLPRRPRALQFTPSKAPLVSVAVLGDRDWRSVNRCLHSLLRLEAECALEILVFHDPVIAHEMHLHKGVQLVSLPNGTRFIDVLEQAGTRARGRYLYVLDSRAVTATGAIAALASTLEHDSGIAVAGSKMRTLHGRLYEAGRGILGDGTIARFGANHSIADSRFAFLRDVQSVSPAGFMIRIGALRAALSEAATFTTASYITAALCLELWSRGLRCVRQPLSTVLLGDDEQMNDVASPGEAEALAGKWLRNAKLDRFAEAGALLVVDEHVPFEDRDAGSRRLALLLRFARANRWSVVFGSLDRRPYPPYWDNLTQSGIEVILGFTKNTLKDVSAGGRRFDCVWLSRPQVASVYVDAVRLSQPQAKVVYDTVDLHHLRLARQAAVQSQPADSKSMERVELDAARRSDLTVVTSSHEAEILRTKGIAEVAVVGLAESPTLHVPDLRGRSGVLFVGNYAHAPNVDAAVWLATGIMPEVRERIPGLVVTLAGADPTPALKRLSSELVRVPGFVSDLGQLLDAHRVFAAPLRFGAGLKGKIIQAMAAGIPIVTTSVGAEGIAGSEDELVIADERGSFAAALVRLHERNDEWQLYSNRIRKGVLRFSPEVLARQLCAVLDSAKAAPP